MLIFLLVITALSVTLADSYDYFEAPPYDEAITMNCPDECPLLYQPICTGGVNYANQCELDCENRHRREMYLPDLYPICYQTCAKCRVKERKTERPHHRLVNPLKGVEKKDNGVTFGSLCLLNCEIKRRERRGSDPLKLKCSKPCPECT